MALTRRVTDNNIEFISTKAGQAALAERDAERTLTRRGLIGELRTLEREAEQAFPEMVAAEERAIAKVRRAEAALRAARQEHASVLGSRQTASFAFSRRHDALEEQLRETASALISDFVRELDLRWGECRRAGAVIEQETEKNIANVSRRVIKTNTWSISARMRAIREAQEGARQLALEVDDQSTATIGPKLQRLREALPEISQTLKARE